MFRTTRDAIRATQDVSFIGGVIATHLVMINTRALLAVPGDFWHRTCRRNAERCLHPRPTGPDADQLSDPVCCPQWADMLQGLPVPTTA